MNNLIKLGVAGSLALGSLAAQASITVPTTSGNPGNAVLFADIFNGTTLVAAYAGDTGVSLNSLAAGTKPSTFDDSNLQSFLSQATAGTTVDWLVVGSGGNANEVPLEVVSVYGSKATALNTLGDQTGATLTTGNTQLVEVLNNVNGLINGSATSWLGKDDSILSGNGFAPFQTNTDISNLGGATGQVATAGLGLTSTLYVLSAANQFGGTFATITPQFNVSLTSSGLTYSAISSGSPVPIPAAVWLLGSGLLGLAGVARRKSAAV